MDISERLSGLRTLMKRERVDTYIVTKFDPHQSEYSPAYWNGVRFISGFKGSAGVVVVTDTQAGLWTDGRYAIAAAKEIKDSGITLHLTSEPGVKGFLSFAADETPPGGVIGFDGRTVSADQAAKLREQTKHKQVSLITDIDLIGQLWTGRPAISGAAVYDHDTAFCGVPRTEKIRALRERMEKKGAEVYVLSSTDDIAWLFNLRGNDQPCSTCFASFAVITQESATLFIHNEKSGVVRKLLEEDGVDLRDYDDIFPFLKGLGRVHVVLNPRATSYAVHNALDGCDISEAEHDYTTYMKAVKNHVELANLEKTNVRDGVAIVRFIKWIKENAHRHAVTEYDTSCKLEELRGMGENYTGPSFETISAYMANAAMMHYSAKKDDCAEIEAKGMLLVDSGGHYYDGTTDITRTIVLGEVTRQMRTDFTLVLKSHIALARAVFLHGATGSNLDVLARMPMWERGLDYKCGTGHGIGFFLNVHEGPHSIRLTPNAVKLEPGMVMSNEPGVYREGQYGIRTENIMVVEPRFATEFGRFLGFNTISYCPIDLDGLDVSLLNGDECGWLNSYHKTVFEKLSPWLNDDERTWLRHETREI